ncbi:MAG: hypothetical protein ABIJ61_07980 [bacterium]
MAQPGPGDVHIDSALTDFSVAYLQSPAASVARRAFPVVGSAKQSDKYFVWTIADHMRSETRGRAPGTRAATRDFALSNDNFYCDVKALAHNISSQVKANADPAVDPEETAVRMLLQDMMIAEEVAFSATAFASSWGTNTSPGTVWDNAAAYPISDLATGIRTVLLATGFKPNVLLLGNDSWVTGLGLHEDLVDRLPDNSARIVTREFVANLLGLDEILVSEVVYNSAGEGLAASNAFAATRNAALLFYRNPSPGLLGANAGATFVWSGLLGAAQGVQVKRYDVPVEDAYPRLEVETAYDHKIVGSGLGYYLTSCVT